MCSHIGAVLSMHVSTVPSILICIGSHTAKGGTELVNISVFTPRGSVWVISTNRPGHENAGKNIANSKLEVGM